MPFPGTGHSTTLSDVPLRSPADETDISLSGNSVQPQTGPSPESLPSEGKPSFVIAVEECKQSGKLTESDQIRSTKSFLATNEKVSSM